jgi:Mor family transcriptional regulator
MAKASAVSKPAAETAPYVPDENDIVADILAVVRDIWPDLPVDKLRQAEAQIRERWGGDRPYISRRPGAGRSARNEAICRDHRNGERIPLLARRYQLTERRIIQILALVPAAAP